MYFIMYYFSTLNCRRRKKAAPDKPYSVHKRELPLGLQKAKAGASQKRFHCSILWYGYIPRTYFEDFGNIHDEHDSRLVGRLVAVRSVQVCIHWDVRGGYILDVYYIVCIRCREYQSWHNRQLSVYQSTFSGPKLVYFHKENYRGPNKKISHFIPIYVTSKSLQNRLK